MDFKQLETFLTLTEIKNFTKTANELHYAQSNVTTQIQKLEEELGCLLFNRIGHSVSLTQKGKELIPFAKQILLLANQAKEVISNNEKGQLTIAASESICLYKLPSLIQSFKAIYPHIDIFLKIIDTSDYLSLLSNNDIDIAYILDKPLNNQYIHSYFQQKEAIGIFALPTHYLASKQKLIINDLKNEKFILTTRECCYRKQFEEDIEKNSLSLNIIMETSSLQAIKELTLSGLGICVLPKMAVEKELKSKQLTMLNYNNDYHIYSQLIHHKDKWISPILTAFIDFVLKHEK